MTPEEWTAKVERATFLYWGSYNDQLTLTGLRRIQDAREFAENLAH
jgi:hypothetical protein